MNVFFHFPSFFSGRGSMSKSHFDHGRHRKILEDPVSVQQPPQSSRPLFKGRKPKRSFNGPQRTQPKPHAPVTSASLDRRDSLAVKPVAQAGQTGIFPPTVPGGAAPGSQAAKLPRRPEAAKDL